MRTHLRHAAPSVEALARRLLIKTIVAAAAFLTLFLYMINTRQSATRDNTHRINQLGCLIIAGTPDSTAPIVPYLRKLYGCPPYGKDPNFRLYPTPTPTPTAKGRP